MVKRLGIIFAGLLIVLLLSNISFNANVQVLAQQNTSASTANTSVPIASDTVSSITKLTGGVKIVSPDKGNLVPLNSNSSLVIKGVSKDNGTSDCDVSVIINNVKPYQNVNPTGVQGDNDYSNWQYTVSSNYTNINEGNNKITSKILCLDGPQTLQAFYSVNITATNFTQPQLSSYNMMLESSNSTNSGNMSQASSGLQQPLAQIQQFNQDTGNGPICCKTTASSSTGSGSSGSSSSSSNDDDSSSSSSNDDDSSSSSSNDDDSSSSSSSSSNDDDSSSSSSSSSNDDDSSSSSSNDDDSSSSSSSNDDDSSSSRSNDDDSSSSSSNDDDSSSSSSSSSNDDDSSSSSSSSSNDDDSSSSSSNDDDSSSSSSNDDDSSSSSSSRSNDDDSSSSSRSNDDDDDSFMDGFSFSNSIDDSDIGFDFDNDNDDLSDSSSSGMDGILDDVEDTMRSVGIDFSFS